MRVLSLLFYTGLASALVPPCLPQLGPEFCPSSQALNTNYDTPYEAFRKSHPAVFPNSTSQNDSLEQLFLQLNKTRMEKDLREFTDPNEFTNRWCYSEFGPKSYSWILQKLHNHAPIRAEYISNQTPQNSIVVKIPGFSNNSISIGAHMDSILNTLQNFTGNEWIAPGADNNGSGSVVLLEVFRQYLSYIEYMGPMENEVQFHWYGAEEVGLLGSGTVFAEMSSRSFPLKAMLNLDMVGYPGGGLDKIGVQQDEYVDKNLTDFVRTLVETYTSASPGNITCGYPCSDHASAHKYNYSSAMIGESAYIKGDPFHPNSNPFTHTPDDTIENNIDFDYMMEFAKLGLAFVVELADYDGFE